MNQYTQEQRQTIANNILKQIGGNTLAYVGAHSFVSGEEDGRVSLTFKCSGKNFKRGLYITISYDPKTDLYNVKAVRVFNYKHTDIATFKDVYASELSDFVEKITDGDIASIAGKVMEDGGAVVDDFLEEPEPIAPVELYKDVIKYQDYIKTPKIKSPFYGEEGIEYIKKYDTYSDSFRYFKNGRRNSVSIGPGNAYKIYLESLGIKWESLPRDHKHVLAQRPMLEEGGELDKLFSDMYTDEDESQPLNTDLEWRNFQRGFTKVASETIDINQPTHFYEHTQLPGKIFFDENSQAWIVQGENETEMAASIEEAKNMAYSRLISGIMAAGGGVSAESFSSIKMEFPVKISVIVPSTHSVSSQITKGEFEERIKEVELFLSNLFGGYTETSADGGYVDTKSKLVTEQVSIVTAFAKDKDFEQNKEKLFGAIVGWCKKWGQEAIGLEIMGELLYIGPKYNEFEEHTTVPTKEEMFESGGELVYKGPKLKLSLKETPQGGSAVFDYPTSPFYGTYNIRWTKNPSLANSAITKDGKPVTGNLKREILLSLLKARAIAKGEITMKTGGPVDSWHMPDGAVYKYAKSVKKQYPEIWSKGGNIFGNTAFEMLEVVIKRGYWLKEEEWFYKKWQAFGARHKKDYRLPGVIANLKWLFWVDSGEEYVRELIEQAAKK